ncbi:sarcosine oxidase subunit gamma family protein [Salinibacterium sp. ZJ454]|uniref:sarcosine oxidase subunit gamma n=1 Tax=Salinibacterium sp. ZJ454 TaxID=2708339 RepID=UPI00141E8428|nr:sarcosine oxidase subunit gamma family protein [Salinibacterium sp. ZJ454]
MAESTVTKRTELERRPLAHLEAALVEGSVTGERGVTLREVAFLTMISMRVDPAQPAAIRLADVLGTSLPLTYGTVGAGPEHQVLWLGPNEFLVVSKDDAGELTARLVEALGESSGLVVDVSANRTTLELNGPSAREVLEKGCMLDLHPRAFTPGTAVSTQIGPVPVILWQTTEIPTYRILPRASFSDYAARWLLDAMLEYAEPEVP